MRGTAGGNRRANSVAWSATAHERRAFASPRVSLRAPALAHLCTARRPLPPIHRVQCGRPCCSHPACPPFCRVSSSAIVCNRRTRAYPELSPPPHPWRVGPRLQPPPSHAPSSTKPSPGTRWRSSGFNRNSRPNSRSTRGRPVDRTTTASPTTHRRACKRFRPACATESMN